MKKTPPPKLKKFAAAKQRQLDELLDKNSEGTITPAEKARLERLVSEAERLTVENTKRLAAFSQTETAAQAPRGRARDRLGFTAAHGTLNDGAGRNVPAARHGAGRRRLRVLPLARIGDSSDLPRAALCAAVPRRQHDDEQSPLRPEASGSSWANRLIGGDCRLIAESGAASDRRHVTSRFRLAPEGR